jgi:hypothetical protein
VRGLVESEVKNGEIEQSITGELFRSPEEGKERRSYSREDS